MTEALGDRRLTPRRRVLKPGSIVLNERHSIIDCQVRSQSVSGARLKIAMVIGIPDQFELRVRDEPPRQCRIVWRSGQEIGVVFE